MDRGRRPICGEIEGLGQIAGQPIGAEGDIAGRVPAYGDGGPPDGRQSLQHAAPNLAACPQNEDRAVIAPGIAFTIAAHARA